MTPYDNILSKIGFFHDLTGQNKLSKSFGDNVVIAVSNGSNDGPSILHFSGDQRESSVASDTLTKRHSPRYEAFISILHNAVFKTLDKQGSTPVVGNPTPPIPVFDTSSSIALISLNPVFVQYPIPTAGSEAIWVASLAPLLGALAPVPPPIVQTGAILSALGIVLTPTVPVQPPTYSLNTLPGFEFMNKEKKVPGFEFESLLLELVSVPYKVISAFSSPNIMYAHNPTLLRTQIYESCLSEVANLTTLLKLIAKPLNPRTLLASIIVWLRNVSIVIAVVTIGSMIGVGNITKNAASMLGAI